MQIVAAHLLSSVLSEGLADTGHTSNQMVGNGVSRYR